MIVSNEEDDLDEFENTFGLRSKRISSATKKWGPDTIIISKGLLAMTYERQMYKNLFCENCIKW